MLETQMGEHAVTARQLYRNGPNPLRATSVVRVASAVMLAMCLAACATAPPKDSAPAAEAPRNSTAGAPASQAPSGNAPTAASKSFPGRTLTEQSAVITIAAVGDMMIGTDYPKNILPDDDGVGFLKDVTPILSAADVTFGNLEGVLMDGGEPVKVCKVPENCFLFRTPTRYAQYYRDAGFDVLSLANNHARDFGEEGRESSMRTLDKVGILHSGRQGDVASWTVNGRRFAMIAFAPTPCPPVSCKRPSSVQLAATLPSHARL